MYSYNRYDSNRKPPQSVPVQTRARVDTVIVSKRCLIENVDESNGVEYVYCLAVTSSNKVLDGLEFSWNMPRFSLNLQSRQNVMLLTPSMHNLLNSGAWLLLPEASIVQQFLDTTYNRMRGQGYTDPVLPGGPLFNYRLVAHPCRMKSVSIFRKNWSHVDHSCTAAPLSADDFTHYSYPFDGFPIITSHIHPRFVICNGGAKLCGDSDDWANGDKELERSIHNVYKIWTWWTRRVNFVDSEWETFLWLGDQQGTTNPHCVPHPSTINTRRLRLPLRHPRQSEISWGSSDCT